MLAHFFAVDPQMPLLSKSNLVPSTQHWPECPAWYAEMFYRGKVQNYRAQYEDCWWRCRFSCGGGCCPPNASQQSFNAARLHRRPFCWMEVG